MSVDPNLPAAPDPTPGRRDPFGPAFGLLAVNLLDDPCLCTPAISNGTLFVRTQHHLWALGKK